MYIFMLILLSCEPMNQESLLVSENMRPCFHGSNPIGLILDSQALPILLNPASKPIAFKHVLAETLVVSFQPCHTITGWCGHQR